MTYTEFVENLQSLGVFSTGDTEFTAIIPAVIQYAEGRIYREIDALATHTTGVVDLAANNRSVSLSSLSPKIIVPETVAVITPAATAPDSGTRNNVRLVNRDFLDFAFRQVLSGTGLPRYWAMYDADTLRVAPTPDAAYKLEVVGTYQPAALSASNTTTILSTYFPELMTACAMIFVSGYERNYGAQASDPQQAASWEGEYQKLKMGVVDQISRQKGQGAGWSPYRNPPEGARPRS